MVNPVIPVSYSRHLYSFPIPVICKLQNVGNIVQSTAQSNPRHRTAVRWEHIPATLQASRFVSNRYQLSLAYPFKPYTTRGSQPKKSYTRSSAYYCDPRQNSKRLLPQPPSPRTLAEPRIFLAASSVQEPYGRFSPPQLRRFKAGTPRTRNLGYIINTGKISPKEGCADGNQAGIVLSKSRILLRDEFSKPVRRALINILGSTFTAGTSRRNNKL